MAASKPKPPAGIDGEALEEWNRITKEIGKGGAITKEDRAILTVYVRTWATHHAAAAHVAQHGAVIKWPNGLPGPNPHYKIQNETGKALRGLLADLKQTPASRPPPKKDDADDELEKF